MLYYLSPVSPLHTGYPSATEYYPRHSSSDYYESQAARYPYSHLVDQNHYTHHYVDLESTVERAAHEYALAQRRVLALRQQHVQRARLIEQQRREQRRRAEAEAMTRIAMQQAAVVRQRRLKQLYEEYVQEQVEEARRVRAVLSYRQEVRRKQELQQQQRDAAQEAFLAALLDKASQAPEVKVCLIICPVLFHARSDHVYNQRAPSPVHETASAQDLLRRRLETDEDTEVREIIEGLLGSIFNHEPSPKQSAATQPTKQDKGKGRETPAIPFPWTQPTAKPQPLPTKTVHFDTPAPALQSTSQPVGADLKRAPAIRVPSTTSTATQLALGAIDRISALLHELKGSFVFPTELDHAPATRSPSPVPSLSGDGESAQLPFTSRNKPIHVYEHALNGLLTKLDAVESNGDEEVRRRRKEVVIEIEKALEDVEKHVAEMSPKLEKAALTSDVPETEASEVVVVTEDTAEQALTTEDIAVPETVEHLAEDLDTQNSTASELPTTTDAEVVNDTPVILEPTVDSPVSSTPDLQVEAVQPETVELVSEEPTSETEHLPNYDNVDPETAPADVTPSTDEVSVPAPEETPIVDKADTSSSSVTNSPAVDSIPTSEPTDSDTVTLDAPQADAPVAEAEAEVPVLLTPSSEVTNDAFLLRPESHDGDSSYERAKARVAASKEGVETEWEDAELASVSDGEAWSEVE
jgi:hypothetical protein